jgi:hypothetical protein
LLGYDDARRGCRIVIIGVIHQPQRLSPGALPLGNRPHLRPFTEAAGSQRAGAGAPARSRKWIREATPVRRRSVRWLLAVARAAAPRPSRPAA